MGRWRVLNLQIVNGKHIDSHLRRMDDFCRESSPRYRNDVVKIGVRLPFRSFVENRERYVFVCVVINIRSFIISIPFGDLLLSVFVVIVGELRFGKLFDAVAAGSGVIWIVSTAQASKIASDWVYYHHALRSVFGQFIVLFSFGVHVGELRCRDAGYCVDAHDWLDVNHHSRSGADVLVERELVFGSKRAVWLSEIMPAVFFVDVLV